MTPTLRPHRRLALAWWLAAALLFAQTLGLAHGVLHAPGAGNDSALFGQHDGNDCRLFDQLAHGDALVAALPQLPPAPPAATPAAPLQTGSTPVFAAAYSARGPPRG